MSPRCRFGPSGPALVALAAVTLSTFGCARMAEEIGIAPMSPEEVKATVEEWRKKRDASLRKEDGWLTLAGLYWLEEGDTSFGSSADNDIVFPEASIAGDAGIFRRSGMEVTLVPAAGTEMTTNSGAPEGAAAGSRTSPLTGPILLLPDTAEEGPTVVNSGTLCFYAIVRGDLVGIRLKDSNNPVLANFEGMDYFDIDPSWHVVARYELFDEPKILRTPNVLGTVDEEEINGAVVFERDGTEYRIEPSGTPEDGFFLVFGDLTNGKETYGGGRFLYSEPVADDGSVVVDFNKSYCPPCVFTPFATCPLPAPQNKLALRIPAGEKNFGQ